MLPVLAEPPVEITPPAARGPAPRRDDFAQTRREACVPGAQEPLRATRAEAADPARSKASPSTESTVPEGESPSGDAVPSGGAEGDDVATAAPPSERSTPNDPVGATETRPATSTGRPMAVPVPGEGVAAHLAVSHAGSEVNGAAAATVQAEAVPPTPSETPATVPTAPTEPVSSATLVQPVALPDAETVSASSAAQRVTTSPATPSSTASANAADQAPRAVAPAADPQQPAGDGEQRAGSEDRRPSPRAPLPVGPERGAPPAAARAQQVDQVVRLEQITGESVTPAGRLQSATGSTTSAASVQTLAPASVETSDMESARFGARVLRGLSAMVNQRGGVMTMRLQPADLGAMRVQMNLARGVVSASFQVTTAPALAMLEDNLSTLRTALERQGLTVERLTVQMTPTAQNSAGSGGHGADHGAEARGERDAGGGESRGRGDQSGRRSSSSEPSETFERWASEAFSSEEIRAGEGG
jgi:flagellar hook-length control protein FliK